MPKSQDVTVKHFPIVDYSVPPKSLMTQILDEIDEAIKQGKTVYVHCHGGVGRTGMVIGCYFAQHGYPGEMALEKLKHVWDSCPKAAVARSPETREQCDYILQWVE